MYCDGEVGAAVATGDGEEIMRVCISFLTVELMRSGSDPQTACTKAIERVLQLTRDTQRPAMHSEGLVVGVVAMNIEGVVGAASTLDHTNEHR